MIVITIMVSVGGVSCYGFSSWRANHQRQMQVTALMQDIALAQQMARSYHQSVILCGSENGESCSGDWSAGRLAYIKDNREAQKPARHFFYHQLHLKHAKWLWRSAFNKNDRLIFGPRGDNLSQRGSFYYCPKSHAQAWIWRVVINQVGRVTNQKYQNDQQCRRA